ncbi:MAG: hypothetical protein R3A80_02900 [Bdellovibrionota bacterium]
MDFNNKKFNIALATGLFLLAAGGPIACGKKTGSSATATTTPPIVNPGSDNTDDEYTRRCRIPVRFSNGDAHEAALEALVQARVNRRERPTTMCIAAPLSPIKRFPASLRFEYEDNYGLRWVTFRKQDLVYSEQGSTKFRLLYLDMYGYVEVNATGSNGQYSGVARLANIDESSSYLDDIEEFLNTIKQTCNESPAKCLNPIFVTNPNSYRPPTETELLQRASEAFQGQHGAEVHTLGTVSFDANYIESTLF